MQHLQKKYFEKNNMKFEELKEAIEKNSAEIVFKEEKHEYYFEDLAIPSTTTILTSLYGHKIYPRKSNFIAHKLMQTNIMNAGVRGTKVHTVIEKDLSGEKNIEVEEELIPFLEKYKLWKESYFKYEAPQNFILEKRMHYNGMFAGTVDLIVHYPKKKEIHIIDFKTSLQHKTTYYFQLWMYREMLDYATKCEIGTYNKIVCMNVMLNPKYTGRRAITFDSHMENRCKSFFGSLQNILVCV